MLSRSPSKAPFRNSILAPSRSLPELQAHNVKGKCRAAKVLPASTYPPMALPAASSCRRACSSAGM